MSNLKDYKKIVQGINQEHINNDVVVEIYSAYGGMVCWSGKLSRLLNVLKNEERQVNRDFYISLKTNKVS